MKLKFIIPGVPKAKARSRATSGGYQYTDKDQVNYEVWIKQCFIEAFPAHKPFAGPISISIACLFPRPKYHYGTGKNEGKVKDSAPDKHTKKPDLDNIVKSIKDGLNKVAWRDDGQVWDLGETYKVYTDDMPKVIVEIEGE